MRHMWAIINLERVTTGEPEKVDFLRDVDGDLILFDTLEEAAQWRENGGWRQANPSRIVEL